MLKCIAVAGTIFLSDGTDMTNIHAMSEYRVSSCGWSGNACLEGNVIGVGRFNYWDLPESMKGATVDQVLLACEAQAWPDVQSFPTN